MDFSRRSLLTGMAALGVSQSALAANPMGMPRSPVQPNSASLVSHYRYPD